MEDFQNNSNPSFTDEVKNFYAGDFKEILVTFFKKPTDGVINIIQHPSDKTYSHAIILYLSVAVFYVVGTFLLAGEMREYLQFKTYLSLALLPVLVMLIITALTFLIKSISGKLNFRDELITGALCGIPLAFLVVGFFIAKLLGEDNLLMMLSNPLGGGTIVLLTFLYAFLMLTNIFQQSLRAVAINETLSWYLSPFCIYLAFYLASKISMNLFS